MDTKPVVAPLTIASAMDAQGNVVVWDHGPQEPDAEHDSAVWKQYEADLKAWEDEYLGLPQPLVMAAADVAHAISTDPVRFTLEPVGLDEGIVAAKVKEMQDRRAVKAKAEIARAEAIQLAADRKAAIALIISEHRAVLEAKKAADAQARRRPLPRVHPMGAPPAKVPSRTL